MFHAYTTSTSVLLRYVKNYFFLKYIIKKLCAHHIYCALLWYLPSVGAPSTSAQTTQTTAIKPSVAPATCGTPSLCPRHAPPTKAAPTPLQANNCQLSTDVKRWDVTNNQPASTSSIQAIIRTHHRLEIWIRNLEEYFVQHNIYLAIETYFKVLGIISSIIKYSNYLSTVNVKIYFFHTVKCASRSQNMREPI